MISVQSVESKALISLPSWKPIHPQKAKITPLAASLDCISLYSMSPLLSSNSRFLSALHWKLFIALQPSQLALLHNLICLANIHFGSVHLTASQYIPLCFSTVLSYRPASLRAHPQGPTRNPFLKVHLGCAAFQETNHSSNPKLQILLGKGCTFHPCGKELGSLWLTMKSKNAEMRLWTWDFPGEPCPSQVGHRWISRSLKPPGLRIFPITLFSHTGDPVRIRVWEFSQ